MSTKTSKERSPEDQRRQAFTNFMAALDAKDIPMSMAATFQAGWDAAMRRPRPAPETPQPASKEEASQGPWWTPTAEVERLIRWCKGVNTITVEISIKVLEGLLHDSMLWRQDRITKQRASDETDERYSQAYADQMRKALLTIATSSLTPDRVRQFAHKGLLRSFPVESSPEKASAQSFEVNNGPMTLPCDHCGRSLDEHVGIGLPCPTVNGGPSHG